MKKLLAVREFPALVVFVVVGVVAGEIVIRFFPSAVNHALIAACALASAALWVITGICINLREEISGKIKAKFMSVSRIFLGKRG